MNPSGDSPDGKCSGVPRVAQVGTTCVRSTGNLSCVTDSRTALFVGRGSNCGFLCLRHTASAKLCHPRKSSRFRCASSQQHVFAACVNRPLSLVIDRQPGTPKCLRNLICTATGPLMKSVGTILGAVIRPEILFPIVNAAGGAIHQAARLNLCLTDNRPAAVGNAVIPQKLRFNRDCREERRSNGRFRHQHFQNPGRQKPFHSLKNERALAESISPVAERNREDVTHLHLQTRIGLTLNGRSRIQSRADAEPKLRRLLPAPTRHANRSRHRSSTASRRARPRCPCTVRTSNRPAPLRQHSAAQFPAASATPTRSEL